VIVTPDTPVQFLKGVGEGRAKVFQANGLDTVRDLLFFFPFRYEDRRHPTRIADIGRKLEQPVVLRGRVVSAASKISPLKHMKIFQAVFDDGSGTLMLVWFNQAFLADRIRRGDIGLDDLGLPTQRGDLSRDRLETGEPARHEHDVGALGGEGQRDRAPDALAGTGDDRHPILQAEIHE